MDGMVEPVSTRSGESHKPEYRAKLKGVILLRTGLRSNREIAARIGYGANYVQQVLRGKIYPSSAMQRALCALLEMKLPELKALL